MNTQNKHNERVEGILDKRLHRLIVQPTGGDKCPHCGCSGTPLTDGTFTPALAYIDTTELRDLLTALIAEATEEAYDNCEKAVELSSFCRRNLEDRV
jgi:hypothetical protein